MFLCPKSLYNTGLLFLEVNLFCDFIVLLLDEVLRVEDLEWLKGLGFLELDFEDLLFLGCCLAVFVFGGYFPAGYWLG